MTIVKRTVLAMALAGGLVLANYLPAWAALGEENLTLVQILAELIRAKEELRDLNEAADTAVDVSRDLLATYRAVNSGIEELRSYSWDEFAADFEKDFYNQYPALGELQYASRNLEKWAGTRSKSPWTAYEAVSAIADDLTAPLREDVQAGRVNIDQELVLRSEASGGFALAHGAEQATEAFDEQLVALHDAYERDQSPGTASMVNARATLLVAKQQSHVIRLLSRAVRLDGVDKALRYSARMGARNSAYERRDTTKDVVEAALEPPTMMQFEWSPGAP